MFLRIGVRRRIFPVLGVGGASYLDLLARCSVALTAPTLCLAPTRLIAARLTVSLLGRDEGGVVMVIAHRGRYHDHTGQPEHRQCVFKDYEHSWFRLVSSQSCWGEIAQLKSQLGPRFAVQWRRDQVHSLTGTSL